MLVRLSPTTGLETNPTELAHKGGHLRLSRTLHQVGAKARMMDRLNERVQIIKHLLERGEIIVHGPRQRVPKQRISESIPIRRRDDVSLEDIAEYSEERRF
jgi:hypothetical protein